MQFLEWVLALAALAVVVASISYLVITIRSDSSQGSDSCEEYWHRHDGGMKK